MWPFQERSGRSTSWPYFLPAACVSLPPHILTARMRAKPKPNHDCRSRLLFIGGLLCAHLFLGGDGGEYSPVKYLFSDVISKRKSCNGGGNAVFCVEDDSMSAPAGPLVCLGRDQLCCQVSATHLSKIMCCYLLNDKIRFIGGLPKKMLRMETDNAQTDKR